MTAYRVVVTQRMRKSEGEDWYDASFVVYHKSLKSAACVVARFDGLEVDRIVSSINVETIFIAD